MQECMPRLRRSDVSRPGLTRKRCGRGFVYQWPNGQKVTDEDSLLRIASLVIPPAWLDVWICPWPNGHIQATGTDAAGRRQYRYHDDWRKRRDREKFDRAVEFGKALAKLRRAVAADLATPGLTERRVLAAGVRLLDIGCFRVGGEEYAEENETFGIATLQARHVRLQGDDVVFSYPAKGSIDRTVSVRDPEVKKVVRSLLRRPGAGKRDLLAWRQGKKWVNVRAVDLNSYIKGEIGDEFSAKDFRTWAATVLAATELAVRFEPAISGRQRTRCIVAAVAEVAHYLGNTPAVCRSSYIDPRIIESFELGDTIADSLPRRGRVVGSRLQRRVEQAVIEILAGEDAVAA
jgi:DNA topoisomerase IB